MSAAELFAGAGSKPGVEVWRIEAMKPVKQPVADGKLFTGDSYIVLHTWEQKGSTHMNVHFWIGAESSRDEAGAAALLTVELDQARIPLPYINQHRLQKEQKNIYPVASDPVPCLWDIHTYSIRRSTSLTTRRFFFFTLRTWRQ